MAEENKSQEFRLENIDETRNYFFEEIKQNNCTAVNYMERITYFSFCGYWKCSISAFASLNGVSTDIISFAVALKIAGI